MKTYPFHYPNAKEWLPRNWGLEGCMYTTLPLLFVSNNEDVVFDWFLVGYKCTWFNESFLLYFIIIRNLIIINLYPHQNKEQDLKALAFINMLSLWCFYNFLYIIIRMPITVYMLEKKSNDLKTIAEYGQEYGRQNTVCVLYHGYGHYDALKSNP